MSEPECLLESQISIGVFSKILEEAVLRKDKVYFKIIFNTLKTHWELEKAKHGYRYIIDQIKTYVSKNPFSEDAIFLRSIDIPCLF